MLQQLKRANATLQTLWAGISIALITGLAQKVHQLLQPIERAGCSFECLSAPTPEWWTIAMIVLISLGIAAAVYMFVVERKRSKEYKAMEAAMSSVPSRIN